MSLCSVHKLVHSVVIRIQNHSLEKWREIQDIRNLCVCLCMHVCYVGLCWWINWAEDVRVSMCACVCVCAYESRAEDMLRLVRLWPDHF